jgi:hypothetical protein
MDVCLLKEEKMKAVQECNAVQTQLEEFRKQLVGVHEEQALRNKVEDVTWQRDNLDSALASCVKDLSLCKFACKYLTYALSEANKKFSKMMSAALQVPATEST